MQHLLNMADESELPCQIETIFACLSKQYAVLYYTDGRLCIFCQLILEAFHWVLIPVGLIGSTTCLVSRRSS